MVWVAVLVRIKHGAIDGTKWVGMERVLVDTHQGRNPNAQSKQTTFEAIVQFCKTKTE